MSIKKEGQKKSHNASEKREEDFIRSRLTFAPGGMNHYCMMITCALEHFETHGRFDRDDGHCTLVEKQYFIDNHSEPANKNRTWVIADDEENLESKSYRSRLRMNKEGHLSKHAVMHGLLNLTDITTSSRLPLKYKQLAKFWSVKNFMTKGKGALGKPDVGRKYFIALIEMVNEELASKKMTFRVPHNIFIAGYTSLPQLYRYILANRKYDNAVFTVGAGGAEQRLVTGMEDVYHGAFDDKQSVNLTVKLKAFFNTQTDKKLLDTPCFGRHFGYISGGSNLLNSLYLQRFVSDRENVEGFGSVVKVDMSNIVKETTFLRLLLTAISEESDLNIHSMPFYQLKNRCIDELATQWDKGVLFVIYNTFAGIHPRTIELSSTAERSFIEKLLDEIAHSLEKLGIKAKIVFGVHGNFKGRNEYATKIMVPQVPKAAWVKFCKDNDNIQNGQGLAHEIVKHLPEAEVRDDIVNTLLSLDEMISFETPPNRITRAPGKNQTITSGNLKEYRMEKVGEKMDFAREIYEGCTNRRFPQRLLKTLYYYFAVERQSLKEFYLLCATAFCESGLKITSMYRIARGLGLGMSMNCIVNFKDAIKEISFCVSPQESEVPRSMLLAKEEEHVEIELLNEIRHCLVLHSHTYLDASEYTYKTTRDHIYSTQKFEHDKPAGYLSRERIHFEIARLSILLYQEQSQKLTHGAEKFTNRRMKLKYYSVGLRHLLRSVKSPNMIVTPRPALSLEGYIKTLETICFDDVSPDYLINFSFRLYYNGIEGQSQDSYTESFDPIVSHNSPMLGIEIIRLFLSAGQKYLAPSYIIAPVLKGCMDEDLLLKFIINSAVQYWSISAPEQLDHAYQSYLQLFSHYQSYTPEQAVYEYVVNHNVLAVNARLSTSRIGVLNLRKMSDMAKPFIAKNQCKQSYLDQREMLKEAVKRLIQMKDISSLKTKEISTLSDTQIKRVQESKILVLLIKKLMKKLKRYRSCLVYLGCTTGSFVSAQKHMVEVLFMAQHPRLYIASLFPHTKVKKSEKSEQSRVAEAIEEHFGNWVIPVRNRTLYHLVYFVQNYECYKANALRRWEQNEYAETPFSQGLYLRSMSNLRINQDGEQEDYCQTLYINRFYNKLKGPLSKECPAPSRFRYDKLVEDIQNYAERFIRAQQTFFSVFATADGNLESERLRTVQKEQFPEYSLKPEEYVLVSYLIANSGQYNRIRNEAIDILLAEQNHQLVSNMNQLRYSVRINQREDIERYRQMVKSPEQISWFNWERDKGWIQRIERACYNSRSKTSEIEVLFLKGWHLKLIIRELEGMTELQPASMTRTQAAQHDRNLVFSVNQNYLNEQRRKFLEKFDDVMFQLYNMVNQYRLYIRELDISALRNMTNYDYQDLPISIS